jgi:arylsulfatase A-like enzyme
MSIFKTTLKDTDMRAFGILFLCIFCLLFTHSCVQDKSKSTIESPNIVLIISDDQSWTDYGFLGHKHIETPNIDKLAQEGLTFTRGYTTAPLCRPALASIVTGLYPYQHRILGNDPVFQSTVEKNWGIEWLKVREVYNEPHISRIEQNKSLPQLLKESGYVTLQTGKWWEGHYSRGGFTNGMTHGNPELGGRHGDEGLNIGREGLDEIYNFIESATTSETPFFVWYAPFMPHAPHTPPDSLQQKYLSRAPTPAVANYWAMCEWFDITCGQIMHFLDQKNLRENTLVIYVTDNGWIQDPERPNRYAPRSKRAPYDMGIRTPIIFRWSETIPPEMDVTSLVSSIDIATTILAACGINPTDKMQGINVMNNESVKKRETIFVENYAHDFSTPDSSLLQKIVLSGNWKLILHDQLNDPGISPELYNLIDDPHERNNRAAELPEIVRDLAQKLEDG